MQALKTHCQMKHISLVRFVFSSLAISAFTTEMQTTPCLGREVKPPAHAGGTAASPGSQNPTPKTGTFVSSSENLDIPVNASPFCRALYHCFFALASHHSSSVSFWDFSGLSDKNNNNKPNEPSKERAWTFSWRRQCGYSWVCLPAASCLRNELSFLLLPRDTPRLLVTWLQLTTSTCQGDSTSLRRMQQLSWRWDGREVQQCLAKTHRRVFTPAEKL